MVFEIKRYRAEGIAAGTVRHQQVLRRPAGARADAAGAFEGIQKFVADEGVGAVGEAVPVGRGNLEKLFRIRRCMALF